MIDNAAHIGGLLGGFVSGLVLVRPFSAEARGTPQPARLLLAAALVLAPLYLLARPMINDQAVSGRHFTLLLNDFSDADQAATRAQSGILERRQKGEPSESLARELRDQVIDPWRRASRELLDARPLSNDGSREARLQAAMRDYIRAKDQALSQTEAALQSGDAEAFESAHFAWAQVKPLLERLRTIQNSGT